MFDKNKTAAIVAEFFGTFVLASAVLAMITKIGIPYFAATTAGLVLATMVLVIGGISGSHINPAVTVGFWSVKKISSAQAIVYIAAQLLGGLCAWRVAEYFLQQALPNIAGKSFDWRIMLAEALGTFIFTFGIAAAVNQGFDGGKLSAAIGISLTIGIIIASMASNGVLNPAVALGIHSYSLSYVLGPLVGGVLGMNVYQYVFHIEPVVKKSTKSKK
jgi:glycerol uptake facilitator-like aquaporin